MSSRAPTEPSTRRRCLRALLLAWIANSLVAALIGTAYLGDALADARPLVLAFMLGALLSSVATLLLLPTLGLCAWAALWPRARVLGVVQAAVFTLALLLVFADTRIYALFRYHFNGMVWNLLTTEGGQDTFELGRGTWIVLALGCSLAFVLQLYAWRRLVAPRAADSTWNRRLTRTLRIALACLLAVVVFEKLVYAHASFRRDREIMARSRVFPLYQRLTANRTLARLLDVDLRERERLELAPEGVALRYPLEMPRFAAGAARPNILIVVIDSLRWDMLAEPTMPNITRWSRGGRVFQDHASGGNATRFGIFSIVYGIHGAYWMSILEERTPPVLVRALQEQGYDMRVLSTPSQSYPEFRSTAWVTMEDRVEDVLAHNDKIAGDRAVARRFDEWLGEREQHAERAPFFCFALLDAPHQTYRWPPEFTRFEPCEQDIDYLKLASSPTQAQIDGARNAYKNAVLFSDDVTAQMLAALERRGLTENTLVIVTGDHGEEFFENGFFGHTGNFTREQVHVTFVMRGPGVQPGVETRPTCHADVPITLLELLGADPAQRARWAQGENLLAPVEKRERVVASWQELGLWIDEGVLDVPLEGHKGFVEAYDWRWRPHPDGERLLEAHAASIRRLALECRTFLR